MKDFLLSVLFIVILFGGITLLAAVPFLIRDWLRKSRRKKRQQGFQAAWSAIPNCERRFEITAHLHKSDLLRVMELEHRLRYPLLFRLLLTLLFGCWLIGGSIGFWHHVDGSEPLPVWRLLHCMAGVLVGGRLLWGIWISPLLRKRGLRRATDADVATVTETTFTISEEGIHFHPDPELAGHSFPDDPEGGGPGCHVAWPEVDRVDHAEDHLCLYFTSKNFLWIPRDARFQLGEWQKLKRLLEPLDS